ncbi:BRR2C [Symbiodinium microadriaticum]|nr:BRR2C [Symbiodinium microadriaticum]
MLQIMGRAGRPQFDDQGVAVILAEEGLSARWQQLLEGRPLESNLPERLTEALLCEVVAGSIQNREALCTWLAGTFLAVRARKDPLGYAAACPLPHCQARNGHPLAYPQGPDVTGAWVLQK